MLELVLVVPVAATIAITARKHVLQQPGGTGESTPAHLVLELAGFAGGDVEDGPRHAGQSRHVEPVGPVGDARADFVEEGDFLVCFCVAVAVIVIITGGRGRWQGRRRCRAPDTTR